MMFGLEIIMSRAGWGDEVMAVMVMMTWDSWGTQLSHVTCHGFKVITSQCHEPCHECHNISNTNTVSRPGSAIRWCIWNLSELTGYNKIVPNQVSFRAVWFYDKMPAFILTMSSLMSIDWIPLNQSILSLITCEPVIMWHDIMCDKLHGSRPG